MAGPEERLKASGRHVAIVGAFSVAGDDDDRVKTVTFEEAAQAVKFGLRAQRVERTINGIHPFMSLEISTPAEEVEGVSTALPISGTALESELLKVEGSPDPAEIGGKIVVDLMNRLDEQAPFWDPNFDVLLTEAYYFSRMFRKGRGEMVGGVALHDLIYEPGFNRLLTAYLRAPGEDAANILKLAKDAFPGDAFRSGTAGEGLLKLREDLLAHLRDLRAWLNQATSGEGQQGAFAVLQTNAQGGDAAIAGEFDQKLRSLLIRGHRGKSLKEMYAVFREARDSVTQVARSEPLMAFVTSWYFSAFSELKDPRVIADRVFQKLYLEKGWKPTNIDAALEKELFELHAKRLHELHAERFGISSTPAARASANLIETTISEWTRLRKPGRVFRTDQLLAEMGRLFNQLSEKFIPGMKQMRELIEEALKLIHRAEREVDANFTVAGKDGKPVEATADQLAAKLKPIFSSLDEIFTEFQTKKLVEKRTSVDLAKTLDAVVRDNGKANGKDLGKAILKAIATRGAEVESAIMEPLSTNQAKINERGEALEEAVIAEWKAAMSSGGFVAAGSAAGISSSDAKKDDVNKRAKSLPKVAKLAAGLTVNLPSLKSKDSPLAKLDDPAASYEPSKGLTTILPLTQKELLDSIKADNREAVSKDLERVWGDLAKAQSAVLQAKRDIMADDEFLNVVGAPSEADRRALLRALMFGEHLIAAPEATSVLNRQDTSIFPKILFECMRWVGRRSEFEGSGRVALRKPSVEKDPGFADIPLKDMLQVKSEGEGPSSIADFLAYARAEAQRVLGLRDYLTDMKDVKELVEELGRSGSGHVTIVNDTINGRGKLPPTQLEPIYEAPLDGSLPPPGIVFVTRQAFSDRLDHSLSALEQKLFEGENSPLKREADGLTRIQKVAPVSKLGFPLYIGRKLAPGRLPSIVADVDRLGTLVLVLCGIERRGGELGTAWERVQKTTGIAASNKDTYPEFWQRFLEGATIKPAIRSKVIMHAIATRQMERKAAEFRVSLVASVDEMAAQVRRGLHAITWYVHDDRWKSVPPTAANMPVNTPKVFVVSAREPGISTSADEDPIFDLA
ncbi:hypothetical protein M2212_006226 [Bradyrhizobium elkanii]|uniref:hypothetical protein n=1 Tax=Bradyrhizobium elkanii TaxID=29448 RepID=UPI00216870BE|nr:hypothetical protein [Bradyrhizobium elkanii]MCS3479380.1 hypothetical protein [Bradyrhizobium elkanii]